MCRELRLREFRNYEELELTFPDDGVAVIGDNGAGKTNLLEAIYYLEVFRSFRGAPDDQLVRMGAETFYIRGRFVDPITGRTREIAAGYERRGRRKRVTVDGLEAERLGDAIGQIGVVIFSPSDLTLVTGAPGERRRFLDILLSLNSPGYLATLQRYRQILRQRNAMLREGASAALLTAWDEGLVEWGSQIIAARAEWVAARTEAFTERYAAIAGGQPARLSYASAVPDPGKDVEDEGAERASERVTVESAADAFREAIERVRQRERERGLTLTGPHRDDLGLVFESAGGEADLRDFGSGGQQRTASIALRMVEADTVRAARGREPIVLLDDLFAELDPGRSERVLSLLEAEERGQVILTAPKPSDLELRGGTLVRWQIADGQIVKGLDTDES